MNQAPDQFPPGPNDPRFMQAVEWYRQPARLMEKCAKRYGDIFTLRLPPHLGDTVVVSDPEGVKAVFRANGETLHGAIANLGLAPLLGDRSLLLLDGAAHARERRLTMPPFHMDRMKRYAEIMVEATDRAISRWPVARPFQIYSQMKQITLDVILQAVFGIDEAERRGVVRRQLTDLLEKGAPGFTRAHAVRNADQGAAASRDSFAEDFRQTRTALDELIYEEIESRRKTIATQRDDILSMLLEARYEDGTAIGRGHLRDELITLLVTGHETTASSLAWAFELLFRHPSVMQRLTAELSSGSEEYLDAVIKEVLRLRPVFYAAIRKVAVPYEVKGYTLPAGTTLAASIYLAHRRTEAYPEPEAFIPDRWIGSFLPSQYAWIPFGGGTRRCLGGSFATFQMNTVMKRILARAELRPAQAEPERAVRRAVTFVPERGVSAVMDRLRGESSDDEVQANSMRSSTLKGVQADEH